MGLADNAARAAASVKPTVIPIGGGRSITIKPTTAQKQTAAKNYVSKQTAVPVKATPAKPAVVKVPIGGGQYISPNTPNSYKAPASGSGSGSSAGKKTDTGSSSKTGSIETNVVSTGDEGTGGTNQSLIDQMGVQETLDIQAAQNVYDAAAAMRKFQREQAQRQLTDALGEIDRAAIENYKGIANDYAARGMSRSGGYMGAESAAMADKTRADLRANQSVTDFLDQLTLQGTADLNTLNTTKAQIMADYLARRFAASQGG